MSAYYPPPERRDKDKFDSLQIYTENLSSAQNGHAMWNAFTREVTLPDEIDIQIGDVGYWHKGDFFRFFNVFHEDGHPFNTKGVPEGFKPLSLDEEEDLIYIPTYIAAGEVFCGGQIKRVDHGKPEPEGNLKVLTYKLKASGTGAALIVLDDAHKKIIHQNRLAALQKYCDKNVEAWSTYLLRASGFVIPERDVTLIYGYTKTERSVHVAVKPRPKAPSRVSLTVIVRTVRGVDPDMEVPAGWDGECFGGPYIMWPGLLSRYVFVNYMTKNGLIGQLMRVAKDVFAPSRSNTWESGSKESEGDQAGSKIPSKGPVCSPPRE